MDNSLSCLIISDIDQHRINLIHSLIYVMHLDDSEIDMKDYYEKAIPVHIDIPEFKEILKYYKEDPRPVMDHLKTLKRTEVEIKSVKQGKLKYKYFDIIDKIKTDDNGKELIVYLSLDFFHLAKNFRKKIDNHLPLGESNLKSKHAIMLYKILKDSEDPLKLWPVDDLKILFDSQHMEFYAFNNNVIKRAVREINRKSDIYVQVEPYRERRDGATTTTKLQFKVEGETNQCVFRVKLSNKDIVVSKEALIKKKTEKMIDDAVENEYKRSLSIGKIITNKEAYTKKVRRSLMRDWNEYEAKVKIDDWMEMTKFGDETGLVILKNYKEGYEYVTVNNDYLLYAIIENKVLSKDAKDTIKSMRTFLKQGGQVEILKTDTLIQDCEKSYISGETL